MPGCQQKKEIAGMVERGKVVQLGRTATSFMMMEVRGSLKARTFFTDFDAARVSVMPSNPHGEISPNDCFYHSDGKEAERASRPDDASDAEITIRTLSGRGLC